MLLYIALFSLSTLVMIISRIWRSCIQKGHLVRSKSIIEVRSVFRYKEDQDHYDVNNVVS